MTSSKKGACLLCLKRFDIAPSAGSADPEERHGDSVYIRFLRFCTRYFKLGATAQTFLEAAQNNECPLTAFCGPCEGVVLQICLLYDDLQTVRLRLIGKLELVGSELARSKTRVKGLLCKQVLGVLKEQLRVSQIARVELLRKILHVKCKSKGKEVGPVVQVPRGLFPEHWKVDYKTCKTAMMRLIVVFVLASRYIYEAPTKDSDETKEEKILGRRRRGKRSVKSLTRLENENVVKEETSAMETTESWGDDYDAGTSPIPSPVGTFGGGSDAEFQPNDVDSNEELETTKNRRWNLRKRNRRKVNFKESDSEGGDDDDFDDDLKDADYEATIDHTEVTEAISKAKCGRGWPRTGQVEPTLPCPKCDKLFLDKRSVASHLILVHKTRLVYSCSHCDEKFERWKDLRNHCRENHRQMPRLPRWSRTAKTRKCQICGEMCVTLAKLYAHRREVHGKYSGPPRKEAKCTKCDLMFPKVTAMLEHRRTLHKGETSNNHRQIKTKETIKCPICEEEFPSPYQMRLHRKAQHPAENSGFKALSLPATCPDCHLEFPTGRQMIAHRKTEHPDAEQARRCVQCGVWLASKSLWRTHQRNEHKFEWKKHECNVCFRTIVGDERYRRHLEGHEKGTPGRNYECWYCEVCGKHFYREDSLHSHMKKEHEDRFTCTVCKMDCDSGKLLRDHLVEHEKPEKFFYCMICFRGFTSQQYYDIHRKIAHKDQRRVHCDFKYCNEIFDKVEDLNEHLRQHAEEAKAKDDDEWSQVHICKLCGKGFIKEYNFTMHQLTHTPHNVERSGYDCPVSGCGTTVRYMETLLTHYNRMHGMGLLPCKCYICGKEFGSPHTYKDHMRICGENQKTDEKRFCQICGEKFPTLEALNKHKLAEHKTTLRGRAKTEMVQCPEPGCAEMRTERKMNYHLVKAHGKGEKYPCEMCGMLFIDMFRVKEHMVVHFPPKFHCDICGKGFRKPNHVKRHKQVHGENREKEFVCPLCGLSYMTQNGLKFHHWSAHAEKSELSHSCQYCGKAYGRKTLLRLHVKNCAKAHESGKPMLPRKKPGRRSKAKKNDYATVGNTSDEEDSTTEDTKPAEPLPSTSSSQNAPVLYPSFPLSQPVENLPSTSYTQWLETTAGMAYQNPMMLQQDPSHLSASSSPT